MLFLFFLLFVEAKPPTPWNWGGTLWKQVLTPQNMILIAIFLWDVTGLFLAMVGLILSTSWAGFYTDLATLDLEYWFSKVSRFIQPGAASHITLHIKVSSRHIILFGF